MERDIATAVSVFREHPNKNDLEILSILTSMGVDRRTSARLVEFVPAAYCRVVLARLGLRFSDSYQRREPGGTISPEQALSSEPLWGEILAYAGKELADGVSKNELLAVAARSADFEAANKLLNKGSMPENIQFTAVFFAWPPDGPE